MLRTILLLAVLSGTGLLLLARGPASNDISGKWHFVYQTEAGERENDANFKLDGDQVTGKYGEADVKGTFKDGELDLEFPYNSDEAGMTATLKMKGKLKDGKLTGNWQFADYDGTFVATRVE
ncbi:MAG TPA: hypothetical protein VKX25_19910 [Bryobacteraceae bacterium]|jgi:hypothetical protein|nr:hypothetical protein [Bryobacteraceae bacterium]